MAALVSANALAADAIGMGGKLSEAYEHLQSLGVPVMEPVPFVERPAVPTTVYIPIYVPR